MNQSNSKHSTITRVVIFLLHIKAFSLTNNWKTIQQNNSLQIYRTNDFNKLIKLTKTVLFVKFIKWGWMLFREHKRTLSICKTFLKKTFSFLWLLFDLLSLSSIKIKMLLFLKKPSIYEIPDCLYRNKFCYWNKERTNFSYRIHSYFLGNQKNVFAQINYHINKSFSSNK